MFDEIVQELSAVTYKLLPSVSHDINNSMQVVRGALSLAAEDLHDPEELNTYIQLCLTETAAVVALINHLRVIPRADLEPHEVFDINQFLQDVLILLRKYLSQRQIQLSNQIPPEEMLVEDIFSLRHLFLIILMQVIDSLAEMGGGECYISSQQVAGDVRIDLSTKNIEHIDFDQDVAVGDENFDKTSGLIAKLILANELKVTRFEKDGKNYLQFSMRLSS